MSNSTCKSGQKPTLEELLESKKYTEDELKLSDNFNEIVKVRTIESLRRTNRNFKLQKLALLLIVLFVPAFFTLNHSSSNHFSNDPAEKMNSKPIQVDNVFIAKDSPLLLSTFVNEEFDLVSNEVLTLTNEEYEKSFALEKLDISGESSRFVSSSIIDFDVSEKEPNNQYSF